MIRIFLDLRFPTIVSGKMFISGVINFLSNGELSQESKHTKFIFLVI